jgi:hypothetical protein
MVSFTAGATTTKLEQKQKTEFVKTFNVETIAVSVEIDYPFVSVVTEATTKKDVKVKSFELIKPITSEATNDDVGWRDLMFNYSYILKSNLPGIDRIPIASNFSNKERVKIRCDC